MERLSNTSESFYEENMNHVQNGRPDYGNENQKLSIAADTTYQVDSSIEPTQRHLGVGDPVKLFRPLEDPPFKATVGAVNGNENVTVSCDDGSIEDVYFSEEAW